MFEFCLSPCMIPLSPGTHFVSVFKNGYSSTTPAFQVYDLRSGDTIQVSLGLSQLEIGPFMGELAPNALLVSDLGDSCSIAQYRGCVVLINFAGFRCEPCIGELPQLQQVYEDYYERGFRAIVINVGWWNEGPDEFSFIRNELGISMPLLYPDDCGDDAPDLYQVMSTPTNILVDRSGVVVDRFGLTTYSDLQSRITGFLLEE